MQCRTQQEPISFQLEARLLPSPISPYTKQGIEMEGQPLWGCGPPHLGRQRLGKWVISWLFSVIPASWKKDAYGEAGKEQHNSYLLPLVMGKIRWRTLPSPSRPSSWHGEGTLVSVPKGTQGRDATGFTSSCLTPAPCHPQAVLCYLNQKGLG